LELAAKKRNSTPHRSRSGEEAPIIKLVNLDSDDSVSEAPAIFTSNPTEEMRVRFRVDGSSDVMSPPLRLKDAMTAASRSWPNWTSPKSAFRKTAAS